MTLNGVRFVGEEDTAFGETFGSAVAFPRVVYQDGAFYGFDLFAINGDGRILVFFPVSTNPFTGELQQVPGIFNGSDSPDGPGFRGRLDLGTLVIEAPEPAALALFGFGALALGARRRR